MVVIQALNPKDARVLVVEDSPTDQEIIAHALRTFGIRYWQVARTAEEALKKLSYYPFDVALVDYNLPGMNGLQFLENLRLLSPGTSVIIVTGVRLEGIAIAAFKLGASDYISKDEYLTSGIVRSLQAALRDRISKSQAEQRESLGARKQELREANAEAVWLLQAIDDRHGYRPPNEGPRGPMSEEWNQVVRLCVAYIRDGCRLFPEPATQAEDDLLRALVERGVSPRDVFRVYLAALGELGEGDGLDTTSIRPVLFLTHALACLVEELQALVSLQQIQDAQRPA